MKGVFMYKKIQLRKNYLEQEKFCIILILNGF